MIILNKYHTYLRKNRNIENSDYPSFIKKILKYKNKKKTYSSMIYFRYPIWRKNYFKLTDITISNLFSLILLILGNSTSISFRCKELLIDYDILIKLSSYTLNNELLSSVNLYITKYDYNVDKMKLDTKLKMQISITKKSDDLHSISVYMDDYVNYTHSNKTYADKEWGDTLCFDEVLYQKNKIPVCNFDKMFTIIYSELIRILLEEL